MPNDWRHPKFDETFDIHTREQLLWRKYVMQETTGNYFRLVGVERCLDKVMFKLEEGGPGWVSRRARSTLVRENRLCDCLGGRELGLLEEQTEGQCCWTTEAIAAFKEPDSLSSLQMSILERPLSDQLYWRHFLCVSIIVWWSKALQRFWHCLRKSDQIWPFYLNVF